MLNNKRLYFAYVLPTFVATGVIVMGTNMVLLLWTMPGLLNPLRDIKSGAFKHFREGLCMKVPFDEVCNVYNLV